MLKGLSWLYGKLIDVRNLSYSQQLLKSRKLPAATISIGNITVGGTGKTPLVKYLAEYLSGHGEDVCIISRGYKRRNEAERVLVSNKRRILAGLSESGDEPFELATGLLGKSIVIADRDRVGAAEWAAQKFSISVFLLDDAFQHRRAARDLDIVVIDATTAFGNMRSLPAGILREPAGAIERADVAVVTRSDLAPDIEKVISSINDLAPELPVYVCKNEIRGFLPLKNYSAPYSVHAEVLGIPKTQPAFAFCGIGNPANFFEHLKRNGLTIVGFRAFADHHAYEASDIELIQKDCLKSGAEILLTTPKDAVKLDEKMFTLPCLACENSLHFDDKNGFLKTVEVVLQKKES